MARQVVDAEYRVISGPTPRKELPRWFKVAMLSACALLAISTAVFQTAQRHGTTEPPAQVDGTVAPQALPAR